MRGSILVAGTASDAGKSVLTAGICRWLYRRGVKVAPFKAQNMSLNSVVTLDGAEIGRAQAAQAAACCVEPEAAMNPILLKPTGERRSQVIVMGRAIAEHDARSYHELKPSLLPLVVDALDDLRSRFDVVVCEGAGSPAEINLRDHDLTNMGLARAARLPVVLVGDIDRGGVFASLFGSLALLEPEDQRLVAAFVVNKFRGDASILAPGLDMIHALTGRPVLGVLPWQSGLQIDSEDSLALDATAPAGGSGALSVAVVRLRWISNFTDIDALAAEPGLDVRFTTSPAQIADADLVVVPGTKSTIEDLRLLCESGIADALRIRAANDRPVLGICGGYQMLGERIRDEVESGAGSVNGLGVLPVETVFESGKVLARSSGVATAFDASPVHGYEIHHGRTHRFGGEALFEPDEGCRVGAVLGTSWHGVLECDQFRQALLAWAAGKRGRAWSNSDVRFEAVRRQRLDALADLVEQHIDLAALERLIADGAPPELPIVRTELVP